MVAGGLLGAGLELSDLELPPLLDFLVLGGGESNREHPSSLLLATFRLDLLNCRVTEGPEAAAPLASLSLEMLPRVRPILSLFILYTPSEIK